MNKTNALSRFEMYTIIDKLQEAILMHEKVSKAQIRVLLADCKKYLAKYKMPKDVGIIITEDLYRDFNYIVELMYGRTVLKSGTIPFTNKHKRLQSHVKQFAILSTYSGK